MGKLAIPQQVHVARVAVKSLSTDLEAYDIPIGVGEDEVIVALASQIILRGSNEMNQAWLYRKNKENIPTITGWSEEDGVWQKDTAVFDYAKYYVTQATAVGYYDRAKSIYKIYPYPIILIRDPVLLIDCGNATVSVTALLWYLIEKVSEAELTKLMVKDHA